MRFTATLFGVGMLIMALLIGVAGALLTEDDDQEWSIGMLRILDAGMWAAINLVTVGTLLLFFGTNRKR